MLQQQIVKVKLGALIQCSNLLHVTVTSFASWSARRSFMKVVRQKLSS